MTNETAEDDPDWRTMEGMARGGASLTQALMEERASEKARDDRQSSHAVVPASPLSCGVLLDPEH